MAQDEPIPLIQLAQPGVKVLTITVKETVTPGQVQFTMHLEGFEAPMGNNTLAHCEITLFLIQALSEVTKQEVAEQSHALMQRQARQNALATVKAGKVFAG